MNWAIRGPEHGVLNRILTGWSIAPILTVQSGTPYTVINGTDRDFDGSTLGDRPDIGNPNAPVYTRGLVTKSCTSGYYNGNAAITTSNPIAANCVNRSDVHFLQVTSYSPTSSTMESRNSNYTTRYLDLDADLLKKIKINERWQAELRGEFFNVTNNQNFDTPSQNRDVTNSSSASWLNYTIVSGGSRTFRVGGKILF